MCCCVLSCTQADLEFLAGQIARLVTQAQRLNAQLLNRTLSRKEADALRAHYRETTAQLAAAAVRRQEYQQSSAFQRYEALRLLKGLPAAVILELNDATDRLTDGCDALFGKGIKREAESPPTCRAQAVRRPLAACNTILRVKRVKYTPTPHPRAGPEAVRAAGGDPIQALLDEPTDDPDSSEEEAEGEAIYSSEEEGQADGYTTDSE